MALCQSKFNRILYRHLEESYNCRCGKSVKIKDYLSHAERVHKAKTFESCAFCFGVHKFDDDVQKTFQHLDECFRKFVNNFLCGFRETFMIEKKTANRCGSARRVYFRETERNETLNVDGILFFPEWKNVGFYDKKWYRLEMCENPSESPCRISIPFKKSTDVQNLVVTERMENYKYYHVSIRGSAWKVFSSPLDAMSAEFTVLNWWSVCNCSDHVVEKMYKRCTCFRKKVSVETFENTIEKIKSFDEKGKRVKNRGDRIHRHMIFATESPKTLEAIFERVTKNNLQLKDDTLLLPLTCMCQLILATIYNGRMSGRAVRFKI